MTTKSIFMNRGLAALAIAGLMLAAGQARAGTVMTVSSGYWTNSATWGGVVPGAADDVFIAAGHTVTNTGLDVRTINSLSVSGILTHATNGSIEAHKLILEINNNLTIAAGGAIDVSGKGYAMDTGDGAPGTRRGAGGYGGEGGMGRYSALGGTTYGSITNPVRCGSGGGWHSGGGNSGGGAILLQVVGDLVNNGTIAANGATAVGAGSGGSVNITASTVSGNGSITAMGGISATDGGGGGGGRIAVVLKNATDFDGVTFAAEGGPGQATGGEHGAAGTVYLKVAGQDHGRLIVNNVGQGTQSITLFKDATYRFDMITTTNLGIFVTGDYGRLDLTGCLLESDGDTNSIASRIIFGPHADALIWPAAYTNHGVLSQRGTNVFTVPGDLTIAAGGLLTHEINNDIEANKLMMIIGGSLIIAENGAIDVTARGYGAEAGDGKPNPVDKRAGGGYGGEGGFGMYASLPLGSTYGSVTNPVRCGSHVGGGAAILRVVGAVVNNGAISANGDIGFTSGLRSGGSGGGGSGGSINITASALSGSGKVIAAGGQGMNNGGGGGGGRIVVVLTNATDFDSVVFVAAGGVRSGSTYDWHGAAGTICLQTAAQGAGKGSVMIGNGDLATDARTHIPPAINPVLDELARALIVLTNRAAVAATDDVTIGNLLIYENCSWTLDTWTLSVNAQEHSLADLDIRGPGATNRVDHYDQILWIGAPRRTVIKLW